MTPSRDDQNHYKDGGEERGSYHADDGDDLIIMIWSLTIGQSHDYHEYDDRSHHVNDDRSQTSTALKQAQLALGCQGRSDCNSSCFRINIVSVIARIIRIIILTSSESSLSSLEWNHQNHQHLEEKHRNFKC